MTMRPSLLLALTLTIGVGLVGYKARGIGATSNDKSATPVEVKIDNFSFSPATITVPAGTAVRWTNRDDIPHTVVSDDKQFKSGPLDTDDQFTYIFSKPGSYMYFCSIHPKMTAKIIVQ